MGGGVADDRPDRRDAPIVSDSSALIGLDRIGRLDLLPAVYGAILVPPAVAKEVGSLVAHHWIVVRALGQPVDPRVERSALDPGELEAIALAVEGEAAQLILDEVRARRVAADMGLEVVGTAGVLVAAKQLGLVQAVEPHLEALRSHGFRLGARVVTDALRRAGEAE